jgi:tRNA (cytidine/uridine-2'-O-)-methyltransferase
VVLVEPEIHWNTGNAGRTCLAAGARLHLVEPLGFSLDDREVRRAGLDYWPRVAPRVWANWESLERRLPELGEAFFFSAEAPRDLWSVRYPERVVLVFGRESAGLPMGMRKRYHDRLIGIPMRDPELRALNLSSSVAVALYEVLRQRAAPAPAAAAAADDERGGGRERELAASGGDPAE